MSIRRYADGDPLSRYARRHDPVCANLRPISTVTRPITLRASQQRHIITDLRPTTRRDLLTDNRIRPDDGALSDDSCQTVVQIEAAADLRPWRDVSVAQHLADAT